jgi:NADH-quinone oxidoreductase subunit L
MAALEALFPQNDFTLLAFIVLLPLLGAVVNGIFGKRLGKEAVSLLGLTVIAVPFVFRKASTPSASSGRVGSGCRWPCRLPAGARRPATSPLFRSASHCPLTR